MKVSEALEYLVTTDESCAVARALVNGLEKMEKTIIGQGFLRATGTVGERDALARQSSEYTEWRQKFEEAWRDYETQRLKRETAILHVEVWRTQQANQRKGNI